MIPLAVNSKMQGEKKGGKVLQLLGFNPFCYLIYATKGEILGRKAKIIYFLDNNLKHLILLWY